MKHNQPQSSCKLRCCREEFKAQLSGLLKFADEISQQAAFPVDQIGLSNNCNRWLTQAEKLMTDSFTSDYFCAQMIAKSDNVIDNGPVSNLCQMVRLQAEYLRGLEAQINSIPVCFCCMLHNSFKNLFGKKTMIFITFLTLFLGFTTNAWADDTWTTIYYAVDASTVGCYTVKINANIGDNGTWRSSEMTKTGYTYNGKIIYTGQVNEKYGGVDCLQIQLYNGSTWISQKQPYSSWTTSSAYSGKMYDHETEKWVPYSTDASYTIYFADYYGWGNDHGGVKAYAWNSECDYNATWNGKAMTATDKTYNGKTIYSITIDKRYKNVKISAANHSDYATGDLDCYSNSDKICIYNGSAYTWVTYNYDVTLTFDPQNGGSTTKKTTLKGGSITAPSAPSKIGYTFQGWGTDKVAAGGTISNVTADATYDAQWSPITYTVAYAGNNNTGGSTASSTHTYDVAKNLTANGFTREYVVTYDYDGATGGNSAESATATYTFKNWTCSANANTYTDKQSVTNLASTQGATVTMTAQWNSGSVTLPTPTKTGYTFSGWYNADSEVGDGGASYTPTADITLTAHWTAKQTTITLDGNGATTAGTPTQVTAIYGQQLPALESFTAPVKEGFNFKGYFSATTGGTQYYNNAGARSYDGTWASEDATATFYAQWENAATYSLTVATSPTTAFTASSGSTENITLGTPYDISATLAEKGYTFTGWTADPAANAEFGNKNELSTTVTVNNGSVTVTANAEAKTTRLTLLGEGGTPESQSITATYGQSFPQDQGYSAPTRMGYTFNGYFIKEQSDPDGTKGTKIILTDANGKFASGVENWTLKDNLWGKESEAETLHAHWTAKNYTLTLNKHYVDGSASNGTLKVTFDSNEATYTPCTPRAGYTLLGYTTAETEGDGFVYVVDAEGNLIADVDGYTDASGNWVRDGNPTLYAQWQENVTTVTINANETTWGQLQVGNYNQNWGYEKGVSLTTTSTLKAKPANGYKFVNWTIIDGGDNISLSTTTEATTVLSGTGLAVNTATIQANFIEDLSSNWYVEGEAALFKEGWNANENTMMKRTAPNSKSLTWTLTVAEGDKTKNAGFKIYQKVDDSHENWWGYGGGDVYWDIRNTDQNGLHHDNAHDIYFHPTVAGDYTFAINDITAKYPTLTVTYPSVNELHHNFTGSWTHTPGTVTDGVLTVEYNLQESEIKEGLEFEMIYEGTYYGPTEDGHSITPDSKDAWDLVAGQGHHVGLIPSIAGTYTFVFDSKTNKLTYTYPTLPSATTTTTEARYFGETPLDFIGGDGSENNPYQVYTDEKIQITAATLETKAHLTAKYQFGEEDASINNVKEIAVTSTNKQSIEVKAFYQVDGYNAKGETTAKTIYYQGVNKPSLSLTTSWNTQNDEAQEGVNVPENVTVHYSAGNYSGPATVTRSKDGGDPVDFFTVESGAQKSETYTLPDKNVQRQTFVATAEVNGRTFTATKAISIYRLVEITITDTDNLMNHYYMWEDGTNPTREEETWPGKSFFSTLGNAHIFYVKYPSYTHFVLNNGKGATEEGAIQTVNIELPDQSACYTIGEQITTEGDNYNKYNVQVAGECPNKLYVGNIAPVAALQGEGVLVSPQVDIDPLLDANNLVISFNYKDATGITCDQRGRNFMVTATTTGTKNIQVTYSIEGANPVTKDVTVNVTNAIMVQVNVPTSIEWTDHNDMWVYYFNHGLSAAHVRMSWKDYVDGYDRFTARVPLGEDGKVDFLFHEWTLNGEEPWLQTVDVQNVTASGCYTILEEQDDQSNKRKYKRDGDNCWTAYYVEIDMNNGTVYRSNTVEDLTQTVSFFAPDKDAVQAQQGIVRIICNGTQTAVVDAATFDSSTVYTAKITANGEGLTNVAYYTGDYYIRTDGVDGGWSDYKKASHKFTNFSLYPGAKYDYYWVANVKKVSDSQTFNIKGCVGNEYNENLANMIESDNYTDGTGNITVDGYGVNLRFGYNPQTNHFERAILKGAGDNYFLNIQGDNVYNDEACSTQELNETNYNSNPEYSKFNDVSDWVYEKLIFVEIDNQHQSSNVLLKSKAFNGQILYQLGYTTDNFGRSTSTPAQKTVMGLGSTNGKYTLRVIYDYKTNRLSATWEPSGVINEVKKVDSDILFVSNEGGEVKQITFGSDSATARLESLQSVMYVLELENNDQDKKTTPDAQYWIALPFECKISDIFGIENYITLDENRIAQSGYWGIMRYRGDLRAEKGWFIEDTPDGFWEWMYPTETLMPGEGYVLYVEKKSLSWNSITVEEPCEGTEGDCQDGKRLVQKYVKRFYFPSLVEGFTMNKSTEATSKITYPNQPCNITKPADRRAMDSNWKVIAPKSYNNVSIKSAEDQDGTYLLNGPNFIYTYNEHEEKGSRYTPTPTADFEFQAFHGYMAQYGGTITWNPYSKTEHPTSAPYYGEEPSFKGGMLTIELVQNNEQLDRTFVNLSKNGTEGFDQNLDLTKITESCAQIASISEDVLYAGNTLPLDIELVPLNVKVTVKGTYDIALSESLNGLEVNLYDAFEQTTTPLDMMSATVTLEKGEYKDRFYLQLKQKGSDTPTSFDGKLEQYNLPTDKTQKLLINDQIYLINAGRIYNVLGVEE